MRKLFICLSIISVQLLWSQDNINVDLIKAQLPAILEKEFNESNLIIRDMNAGEFVFHIDVLDDYFINNFNEKDDYIILRVKGNNYYDFMDGKPFYFNNILLKVKNDKIEQNWKIPNDNEIVEVEGNQIVFEINSLYFKEGMFYDQNFWTHQNDEKYKYTKAEFLKNSKTKFETDGLRFYETSQYKNNEVVIDGLSNAEKNFEVHMFVRYDEEFKTAKEKKDAVLKFLKFIKKNLNNPSYTDNINEIEKIAKNTPLGEIDALPDSKTLKYNLTDGTEVEFSFLDEYKRKKLKNNQKYNYRVTKLFIDFRNIRNEK